MSFLQAIRQQLWRWRLVAQRIIGVMRLVLLGHEVRLIRPIYVKPFVKRHKNDAADAEAISEAAVRPTMRFVPVKKWSARENTRPPYLSNFACRAVGDLYALI